MNDPVPPYHEHLTELAKELTERGSQGLVVIDASPLEVIEEQYGSDAFEEVRQRLFKILREQKGKEYRNEDVLTLDRPGGLRFIFFLERKRRRSNPTTIADLKIVQSRMAVSLVANLGRAAFPYCKAPPRIEVAVLRGTAERRNYSLVAARIDLGRCAEVRDSRRRLIRTNHIAFTEEPDGVNLTVSRQHAHITCDSRTRHIRLHDDGSGHGSGIVRDGRTVSVPRGSRGVRLRSGDEIVLGEARVRIRFSDT